MSRNKGRGRWQVAVVLGVVAATAGSTLAFGALKTKKAQTLVEPGTTASATAKCKQGSRAVSGGFEAVNFDVLESEVFMVASTRPGRREWSATAGNGLGGDPETLADFAYCSDELPKLKAKTAATDTIPYSEYGSVVARCPKGSQAVSGGFEAPGTGANQVAVLESRRVGKRDWLVGGVGTSLSETRLNAFVYCADEKLGLKAKAASTSTDQEFEVVDPKARCKKGQQVVSGGFGPSGDPEELDEFFLLSSKRAGKRGWRTAAVNYGSVTAVTWTSYAYCLKKEKKG